MPDERHDIYVQYYPRVVAYLVHKHHFTPEEARDIAQDVFVSVFRHMKDKPITAMWLFLKTTAHNRAANEFRSREIHRRTASGSADAMPHLNDVLLRDFWTDDVPPSPETAASRNEESALLRDAILRLPAALRGCVLLRLDGLSYEEVAQAMRITENAVRTRLRDAKRTLSSWLRRGGA